MATPPDKMGRQEQTFEVEADSLEETKKEVNSQIPEGLQLLSSLSLEEQEVQMSGRVESFEPEKLIKDHFRRVTKS